MVDPLSQSTPQVVPFPHSRHGEHGSLICVSIGRGRHRMMKAEHKHLAEQGVQLVELRLDYIRRPVNMKRLLDERPCPAVAACRRPQEGGKWQRTEDDRLVLLRTAIADGADYVDLEADIADKIPRYGHTKRIVSYHNFHETPDNLESIHEMLAEFDPDIIKIATMANSPADNVRTLRLCNSNGGIPTVAFCMGEMGMPSRILCGKFGSPLTYATFHQDRQLAPGMLSFKQMVDEYRYEHIGPATMVFGVIADPIAHSLSPRVHNACMREMKLDMIYLPFRVPAEHLDSFMSVCREMGIRGLSVTIPHKEKILKHINALDDNVVGIRAANTIVYRNENAYGYNTDCQAAMDSLKAALEITETTRPFRGRRALILGSGGVARAIAFGLHRGGANVYVCARDYRKGDALAAQLNCKSLDWPARQNFDCDILINATPMGMHPNLNQSPFEKSWLGKNMLVFDAIYNPEQTLFVKHAREVGCKTVTGVEMFVRQAAVQFELFTGQKPRIDTIREEVRRAISAARY